MNKINNLLKVENNKILQEELRHQAINKGTNLISPETIFLSKDTKIGKKVTIEPYVVIGKKVRIGDNVIIKSFSHIEGAVLEKNVTIGPFARIRPGTKIEQGAKVGNFVETKNSKIKKDSKISHLSYIGDTVVGDQSNIGAGTITCNYDGKKKNKTKIGKKVFIGSNSSLVAPVSIENNSTVGAGSVITKNVKKNSLAISRAKQIQKLNYRKK
jgi:bifunctional UDP-N-acetylglucosamine pyrophosphorylase/glucosamine-1-phosphate N-acetyltransferase